MFNTKNMKQWNTTLYLSDFWKIKHCDNTKGWWRYRKTTICSYTTGGSINWYHCLGSNGDTIQFKASFTWWQSIHFADYIITSVNKMTKFLTEEMKADYYCLNPNNTRRKVILAKNSSILISKKFQDENQNQPFTPFCKPALHMEPANSSLTTVNSDNF